MLEASGAVSGGIVQIAHDCVPASGGTYTSATDFRRALGGQVVSFTSASLLPHPDTTNGGVLHIRTGGGAIRDMYALPARASAELKVVERVVRTAALLIVHGLFRYHAQWAYGVAAKHDIPYWLLPHGTLDPWVFSYRRTRKRLWMAAIGRRVVAGASRVLYATRREAESAAPFVPANIPRFVLPWPVDGATRPAGAGERLRAQLGIDPTARVLLVLGRLHPSKGVTEAIRAVGSISDPHLHLLVAGPETRELSSAQCRALARDCAPGRIHVLGPVGGPDKLATIAAADALISLSKRENFGYAVAEAMSAGLPVILAPEVAIAGLLGGVDCGWLLRDRSTQSVTEAIAAFLAMSQVELTRMGTNACAWAANELSRDRFERQLRELVADDTRGVRRSVSS